MVLDDLMSSKNFKTLVLLKDLLVKFTSFMSYWSIIDLFGSQS